MPRGTQKTTKYEHREAVRKCLKKLASGFASAASKMSARGGVPPTELLRRTTIQANPSKLTRANKLSQAKPEPYEHSTCARGTVADCDVPLCLAAFIFMCSDPRGAADVPGAGRSRPG